MPIAGELFEVLAAEQLLFELPLDRDRDRRLVTWFAGRLVPRLGDDGELAGRVEHRRRALLGEEHVVPAAAVAGAASDRQHAGGAANADAALEVEHRLDRRQEFPA